MKDQLIDLAAQLNDAGYKSVKIEPGDNGTIDITVAPADVYDPETTNFRAVELLRSNGLTCDSANIYCNELTLRDIHSPDRPAPLRKKQRLAQQSAKQKETPSS